MDEFLKDEAAMQRILERAPQDVAPSMQALQKLLHDPEFRHATALLDDNDLM